MNKSTSKLDDFQTFLKKSMDNTRASVWFKQLPTMKDRNRQTLLEIICSQCCFNHKSDDVKIVFQSIINEQTL